MFHRWEYQWQMAFVFTYPLVISHSHGKWSIYRWFTYENWWFSMAMLNNQRVYSLVIGKWWSTNFGVFHWHFGHDTRFQGQLPMVGEFVFPVGASCIMLMDMTYIPYGVLPRHFNTPNISISTSPLFIIFPDMEQWWTTRLPCAQHYGYRMNYSEP